MREEIKYTPAEKALNKNRPGINFKDISNQEDIKNKNYRIEHFKDFDVVVNLDYPNKEEINELLELLRINNLYKTNQFLIKDSFIYKKYEQMMDSEPNIFSRFFFKVKKGYHIEAEIDFIKGRTDRDAIKEEFRNDFDSKSRYARAGILNEIILSQKIKEIVESNEFQDLAKACNFEGIKFAEPIVAIIYKENQDKCLVYKNIKSERSIMKSDNTDLLALGLRRVFLKNGINANDLRATQFIITKEDDKSYIVLIDTEAYTEVGKDKKIN